MPVEQKPLFRPDSLRPFLTDFIPASPIEECKATVKRWADMLSADDADTLNKKEILPDFLADIFCGILGYVRKVDSPERFTFSREKHVQVDGKFADAVLGELSQETQVSDAVNAAFRLSTADIKLMWDTAPPRMPTVRAV